MPAGEPSTNATGAVGAHRHRRFTIDAVAVYIDEGGRERDLDAEQARYARRWWFRFRYSQADETYFASAYRKVWPLHGATANADSENEARADLLELLTEMPSES